VVPRSRNQKLKLIPAGDFMMGSRETPEELAKAFAAYGTKPGYFTNEQPSHRVRITKPFYLGAHEVTRGQFRRFIDDTRYRTDAKL
jgi:formylglycine-generating enzyme required for sulfatase activity